MFKNDKWEKWGGGDNQWGGNNQMSRSGNRNAQDGNRDTRPQGMTMQNQNRGPQNSYGFGNNSDMGNFHGQGSRNRQGESYGAPRDRESSFPNWKGGYNDNQGRDSMVDHQRGRGGNHQNQRGGNMQNQRGGNMQNQRSGNPQNQRGGDNFYQGNMDSRGRGGGSVGGSGGYGGYNSADGGRQFDNFQRNFGNSGNDRGMGNQSGWGAQGNNAVDSNFIQSLVNETLGGPQQSVGDRSRGGPQFSGRPSYKDESMRGRDNSYWDSQRGGQSSRMDQSRRDSGPNPPWENAGGRSGHHRGGDQFNMADRRGVQGPQGRRRLSDVDKGLAIDILKTMLREQLDIEIEARTVNPPNTGFNQWGGRGPSSFQQSQRGMGFRRPAPMRNDNRFMDRFPPRRDMGPKRRRDFDDGLPPRKRPRGGTIYQRIERPMSRPQNRLMSSQITMGDIEKIVSENRDFPADALQCLLCDGFRFKDVNRFMKHIVSKKHAVRETLLQTKIKAQFQFLLAQAKLAYLQQKGNIPPTAVTCTRCEVPDQDHLDIKECMALHQYVEPLSCCFEGSFSSRYEYEEHCMSLSHLKYQYELLIKKDDDDRKDEEKLTSLKEKIQDGTVATIEDASQKKDKTEVFKNPTYYKLSLIHKDFGPNNTVPKEFISLISCQWKKHFLPFQARYKKLPRRAKVHHEQYYDPAYGTGRQFVTVNTDFRCRVCYEFSSQSKEEIVAHCCSKEHYDNVVKEHERMKQRKSKPKEMPSDKKEGNAGAKESVRTRDRSERKDKDDDDDVEDVDIYDDPYLGEAGDISQLVEEEEDGVEKELEDGDIYEENMDENDRGPNAKGKSSGGKNASKAKKPESEEMEENPVDTEEVEQVEKEAEVEQPQEAEDENEEGTEDVEEGTEEQEEADEYVQEEEVEDEQVEDEEEQVEVEEEYVEEEVEEEEEEQEEAPEDE